jgi:hypothetical protein
MKSKNVSYLITLVAFLFIVVGATYAQDEKNVEEPVMKMNDAMSDSTMTNCMDKIASDDGSRTMMMQKMMKSVEGDKMAMKEMCKTMMDNPEMKSMMKDMMGGDMMKDGGMMKDKSNSNDEGGSNSTHESHHKDDNKGNG